MRLALLVVLTSLAVASWSAPAAAQDTAEPPASGEPRDQEARAMYQAGVIAYADGRFADALTSWQRAYELSRRPELLFNIGTAADRLRRDAQALESFEAYLAARPDAANAREVRARIEVLREAIRAATPAPPVGPPPEDGDEGGGGGRVWTWVAAGLGVALGAAGTILWLDGQSTYDELADRCASGAGCTEAEIDDAGLEGRATGVNLLFAGSAVALAAALALFFVEGGGEDEEQPAVSISPGGLRLRWSL